MGTTAARTGSSYDLGAEVLTPATWNRLSKSVDQGILRVLAGMAIPNGVIPNNSGEPIINIINKRFTAPNGTIAGVINGIFFVLTNAHEIDVVATSGSTTAAGSNTLSYVDNYWKDAYIVFTSGVNSGQVRVITEYNSSTGSVKWNTPTAAAVASGDTFTLTFFYISGLTVDAMNYVYARLLARSPYDNVVNFTANTTGVIPSDGILLSTVTLDASGDVLTSNNNPPGAGRTLYCNIGGVDTLTYSALVEAVPANSFLDVEVTHSFLLYRGGIEVTVDNVDCTVIPIEYYKSDKTKIRITNTTASAVDTTYTLNVSGRVRKYI